MFNGVSHIGIVVNDLEEAERRWVDTFGLKVIERLHVEVEGVRNSLLSSTGRSREEGTFIELMEPLDKEDMSNPIARRLANAGEGVYQVAIKVEDALACSAQLRAEGLTVIDRPSVWDGEPPRAVIHPRSANGVLLELL